MTNLTNWISPSTMHSLGWTLLHFLWQGTALSALAAVLMSLCRRASRRYAVGVGTLVLMLAAPVLTFLMVMPSRAAMAREPSSVPHKGADLPVICWLNCRQRYRCHRPRSIISLGWWRPG